MFRIWSSVILGVLVFMFLFERGVLMVFFDSDAILLREYIDEYRVLSFVSSDPYEKILFSVCADVYRRLLDDFLSYSKG